VNEIHQSPSRDRRRKSHVVHVEVRREQVHHASDIRRSEFNDDVDVSGEPRLGVVAGCDRAGDHVWNVRLIESPRYQFQDFELIGHFALDRTPPGTTVDESETHHKGRFTFVYCRS
jgi:hypothetical protein